MNAVSDLTWTAVGPAVNFPEGCGTAVLVEGQQVAVSRGNFNSGDHFHAVVWCDLQRFKRPCNYVMIGNGNHIQP